MSATTQTGIPFIECEVCGRNHPETRRHCNECRMATVFMPADDVCIRCSPKPLEPAS